MTGETYEYEFEFIDGHVIEIMFGRRVFPKIMSRRLILSISTDSRLTL